LQIEREENKKVEENNVDFYQGKKPRIFRCPERGCNKAYDMMSKLQTHIRTHVRYLIPI
jgi:hypothetical protein